MTKNKTKKIIIIIKNIFDIFDLDADIFVLI